MLEESIVVDRPINEVWHALTNKAGWKQWHGGDLKKVDPGWEEKAKLVWAGGDTSRISWFKKLELLEVEGGWFYTTYRLKTADNDKTRFTLEESDPLHGATLTDGGKSRQKKAKATLKRFKQYAEDFNYGQEMQSDQAVLDRAVANVEERYIEAERARKVKAYLLIGIALLVFMIGIAIGFASMKSSKNASTQVQTTGQPDDSIIPPNHPPIE